MSKILGIDLGTTNSAISIIENNSPKIIHNKLGSSTTPSIVYIKDNQIIVGASAKRQSIIHFKNVISGVKRLIGKKYNEIENIQKNISYDLISSELNDIWIKIDDREYSPQMISAYILKDLKDSVESYLNESIIDVVITVPAYFNDIQRQATKDAGRIAGLNVLKILNEPTSAALAYGFDKNFQGNVLVYDLGGGTFDVSILNIKNGNFIVKATAGDTSLGGIDFDNKILEYIVKEYLEDTGIDLYQDKSSIQRLKDAVEVAKIELSTIDKTDINIPFIFQQNHLLFTLDRDLLNFLTKDLIAKTITICKNCILDSGLDIDDIDEIILVGGMTRMPSIQKEIVYSFKKYPNKSINPDEVVAIGASIQGKILEDKQITLKDVIPLSLGIETKGGVMTKIIPKNTQIPYEYTKLFTTVHDNQKIVTLNILQGESLVSKENQRIGQFDLVDIVPMKKGKIKIEVTFHINSDGLLSVTAKDKISGKNQNIEINPSSGLTEEEIQKMIEKAKENEQSELDLITKIDKENSIDEIKYIINDILLQEKIDPIICSVLRDKLRDLRNPENIDLDEFVDGLNKIIQNLK